MTAETLQQATKALLGAGMTLQEIANLCGVSRPAVMAWSSGKSNAYGAHPFWLSLDHKSRRQRDLV